MGMGASVSMPPVMAPPQQQQQQQFRGQQYGGMTGQQQQYGGGGGGGMMGGNLTVAQIKAMEAAKKNEKVVAKEKASSLSRMSVLHTAHDLGLSEWNVGLDVWINEAEEPLWLAAWVCSDVRKRLAEEPGLDSPLPAAGCWQGDAGGRQALARPHLGRVARE